MGWGNNGGSWLPEVKKTNMWHGRGYSGGLWPPAFPRSWNRKKTIKLSLENELID